MWGVSLTPPVLTLFLCGEFVLRIPCCIDFYARSFSYTSRARSFYFSYFFIWAVSFTHPVLVSSFFPGEFLLHIPCWIHSCVFFYLGSLSYTSRARFTFICGVSLTHPMLALLFCVEFLLHIPSWVFQLKTKQNLIWWVSLTHPVLASFLSGEFLLHIPWWLDLYLASFSYTSHAGFSFLWEVSLTHPMLA